MEFLMLKIHIIIRIYLLNSQHNQAMINKFVKDSHNSMKWASHKNPDVIDLTIAEMDFGLYQPFKQALIRNLKSINLSQNTNLSFKQLARNAIINWYKSEHSVDDISQQNQILFFSSICTLTSCSILAVTQLDDNVLVLTPGYPYYQNALTLLKRKVISHELGFDPKTKKFQINWIDLQAKISKSKLLILSHPHNPSGQIWTFQELQRIISLCSKFNTVILSDQILSDMALSSKTTRFCTILNFSYDNIIMGNSLSKSFNTSSFQTGYAIIKNKTLTKLVKDQLQKFYGSVSQPNLIAACYYSICLSPMGKAWLEQINMVFHDNYRELIKIQKQRIPKLIISELDAGYMVMIDFQNLKMANEQLKKLLTVNNIYVSYMMGYYYPEKQTTKIRICLSVEPQTFKVFLQKLIQIFGGPHPRL